MKSVSARSRRSARELCFEPEAICGGYRVIRLLGEGGYGQVYEAEHTGSGERVALEIAVRSLAERDRVGDGSADGDAPGGGDAAGGPARAWLRRLASSGRREALYTGAVIRKPIELEAIAQRATRRQNERSPAASGSSPAVPGHLPAVPEEPLSRDPVGHRHAVVTRRVETRGAWLAAAVMLLFTVLLLLGVAIALY